MPIISGTSNPTTTIDLTVDALDLLGECPALPNDDNSRAIQSSNLRSSVWGKTEEATHKGTHNKINDTISAFLGTPVPDAPRFSASGFSNVSRPSLFPPPGIAGPSKEDADVAEAIRLSQLPAVQPEAAPPAVKVTSAFLNSQPGAGWETA